MDAVEVAVAYALGSGERGYSFLIERDGFVAQSPVAWYAQERRYDIAPGYGGRNFHFERVILPACLSCHVDGARAAGGAYNRYATPLEVRPIGCERCHGPGALARPRAEPGPGGPRPDDRQSPASGPCVPAVGLRAVPPSGRPTASPRPGRPRGGDFARGSRSTNSWRSSSSRGCPAAPGPSARSSRCTRAAASTEVAGRLGCISCHDPHSRPAPAKRVEHYRASCLACHEARGCRLPEPDRRARRADDSCVDCHMPRRGTKDIAHTAMTDHRIPRFERAGTPDAAVDFPARRIGADPVVRFQPGRLGGLSGTEAERDLGIALFHAARERWRQGLATDLASRASGMIDTAVAAQARRRSRAQRPGHILWMRTAAPPLLASIRGHALALKPDDERLLEGAAALAGATGRRDDAVALLRRAAAVNPYCADYPRRLAVLYAEMSQWAEAAGSARAALGLDISLVDARITLVVSQARRVATSPPLRTSSAGIRGFEPRRAAEALHRAIFVKFGAQWLRNSRGRQLRIGASVRFSRRVSVRPASIRKRLVDSAVIRAGDSG